MIIYLLKCSHKNITDNFSNNTNNRNNRNNRNNINNRNNRNNNKISNNKNTKNYINRILKKIENHEEEELNDNINITDNNIELNQYDIVNYQPRQPQKEYVINKDYERIVNPLMPPERRNIYLESSGIVSTPGIPINIPTRGYSGGIVQVGTLHKEDVADETKSIGQSPNPVILPLFGCPTHQGSNKWTYYTSTDGHSQVKLPITNKNRVCNSEHGCDELYDGDNVSIPAYNSNFKVSIYEYDKPRYIPFIPSI